MFRYTQAHKAFIKRKFKTMRIPELTRAFNTTFGLNKTESQIKATISRARITCGRKGPGKGTNIKMTPEQVEFIKDEYRNHPVNDLVALFNQTFQSRKTQNQIKAFIKNHKIHSGRTGQFKKGHIPHPDARPKGPNKTSYKKGQEPLTKRPIGHERICKKDGYILIKTDQTNPYTGAHGWYRAKHIVNWEKAHGKVPEGTVIRFKDNNKLNNDLSNLIAVSKALHLRLNQLKHNDVKTFFHILHLVVFIE